VLRVPAPTPEVRRRLGVRQKTVPHQARQRLLVIRRWRPAVEITVIGDQTSSILELSSACAHGGVLLLAPFRMAAALYAPAPPRLAGTNGRPRLQAERLPQLRQMRKDRQTAWQRVRIR
jgi:hypothetical protein